MAAVFDGGSNGLWIGDVEAKMVIDAIGGGWFEAKMVVVTSGIVGGDSGRHHLTAAMDEGGRSCLTVASVDNRYGVQWWKWRWRLMAEAAFDVLMVLVMYYGKLMARQRWPARREDERGVQGEASQQPAGTMSGQEGGTTRG